jgi:hypothetical protein
MGNFKASNTTSVTITTDDLEVDSGTLSIDASNNRVGIGVTDPDKKLEVNGAIHISGETTTPSQPSGGDGGILYAKADGKLYWRSNEVSENDLTAGASGGTSVAADNITAGDAAVEVETSSGNVLIDSQAGTTTIDGHTGVSIVSSNSGEVDITSAAAIDINATTGITADGTTISIDGTDDSNVTVTGSGKDLDIAVAGGSTQELRLASAGTGASALHLNASAGGINIDSADMIDIDAADEITVDTTSADGHIAITSAHTAGQSILISANADAGAILDIDAGIIDIDVQDTINIDAADEIEIATTSADGHITLTSAHVAGVAFHLDANAHADSEVQIDAGILDIDVTGNASLDSSAGSITIGAALADGQTLKLGKNGAVETIIAPHGTAGSELYSVINTAGTTDGSDAAGSILLSAVAGGIGLAWADDKDLWAEGGQAVITANHNAASAIKLHADAGSSQTIVVVNDEGTSESAIAITSTAGGVDIDAAAGKDVTIDGGQLLLTSAHDTANAIYLRANAGTSETIKIHADQSEVDGAAGAGAIELTADAGGISLNAAAGKDIWAEAGRVVLTANEDAADAIKLHADAGTSQTITVVNDAGTSVTEGSAAVSVQSTAGGVELRSTANLANAINITNDGGTSGTITIFNDQGTSVTEGAASIQLLTDAGGIGIKSTANLANAVLITADGGTDETIVLHADQGTGEGNGNASIELLSDAGGICFTATGLTGVMTDGNSDAAIQAHAAAGGVGIRSTANLAGSIQIEADGGTDETIIIHSDQGSGADSIQITSDAGGIALSAGGLIKTTGAGVEVENGSSSGAPALLIDNDDTDQIAVQVEAANIDANAVSVVADALTTATGIALSVDALTSGKGIDVTCSNNSLNGGVMINAAYSGTSTNNQAVLKLTNDHASATGTSLINMDQDSTGPLIHATYGAFGSAIQLKVAEQEVTLTTDSTTHDVSSFFPAGSVPISIAGRVTVALTNNAFVTKIGTDGDDDMFAASSFGDGQIESAGATFVFFPNNSGTTVFPSADTLRITTNANPTGGGKIRVTLYYWQITAPTS